MDEKYRLLKEKALNEHEELDVPVYDLLKAYIDDRNLLKQLYSDPDFEDSINDEYRGLKDKLYIIDNIDEYKRLNIILDRKAETQLQLQDLLAQRNSLRKEMADLNVDKTILEGRRYGLISMFNGKRRRDKEMLENISVKLDDVSADIKKVAARYEEVKTDNEIVSLAAVDIQSRLKVPCYENNPEVFLKDKYYCLKRISEIESFREGKSSSAKLSLDERIRRAEEGIDLLKESENSRDFER